MLRKAIFFGGGGTLLLSVPFQGDKRAAFSNALVILSRAGAYDLRPFHHQPLPFFLTPAVFRFLNASRFLLLKMFKRLITILPALRTRIYQRMYQPQLIRAFGTRWFYTVSYFFHFHPDRLLPSQIFQWPVLPSHHNRCLLNSLLSEASLQPGLNVLHLKQLKYTLQHLCFFIITHLVYFLYCGCVKIISKKKLPH